MTGVAKHAEKYFKDDSARGGSLRSSGGSSSSSSSSSLASSDDRKPGMEKKASGGGGGSTVGSPTAATAAAAVGGVRTRVVSGVLERNTELERENRDLKRQLRQAQEQMALLKCQLEMGAKVSATISPRDGDGEALASGESMGEGKLSNLVEESAKADRARADAWEQLKKTLKSARERFDAAKASPRAVAAGGGNSDDDPEGKD